MKKFLNIFFVALGIIFFIIILALLYFYIADPLNLKPLISAMQSSGGQGTIVENHPFLTETQQETLQKIGVDPSSVPTEFTKEQITCFESILGKERVSQIIGGDSPTMTEYLQAKDCI